MYVYVSKYHNAFLYYVKRFSVSLRRSVDYEQQLNSYFQVEPGRSGMLLFPLGFCKGSHSNACPIERHVRGIRTTRDA